jgi:polynucleotide 5'-hydroxyl-kinase GRC3/NOL9
MNIPICFSRVLVQNNGRLQRDLRLMAYFRQCLPSDSNISTIKELAHSLTSHCPYHVPIASVKIRHVQRKVGSNVAYYLF